MARIDAELDLHGYSALAARDQLDIVWSRKAWAGLRRVRIIHGTGEVLYRVVREWADDRSIPWTVEPHNPGVTILQPSLRREPQQTPANRPFAKHEKRLREIAVERAAESPPRSGPVPEPDPHADELFAQEIERLERQDARSAHRRKQVL